MIDPEDLKARVAGDGLVLVECWAPTCAACKVFDPAFERVAEKHRDER
jgi:thioredoxin 1